MKIERINENKIKFTLNQEDLADHNLVLTEFAYGSEKARAFFRDIMLQAEDEVGFEADNFPLMIEAVPIGSDSIILFVTKVDEEEQQDNTFEMNEVDPDNIEIKVETHIDEGGSAPEEILNVIRNAVKHAVEGLSRSASEEDDKTDNFIPLDQSAKKVAANGDGNVQKPRFHMAIFKFRKLDDVCNAATMLIGQCNADNTLYKDMLNGDYYLVITSNNIPTDKFSKLINSLSEYGSRVTCTYAIQSYFEEHYMCVIRSNALQTLGA
ncbi:MAG: adaptor protein MecA [Lachnospiraceae bacterium]|nr:adaptor protein MecA [Lachnospiraceae bacterium]